MTSKSKGAYVWIWLEGESDPVVAGRLTQKDNQLVFNYGKSYLARKNAISFYTPELPLKEGIQTPIADMELPSCIRDGSPDAWGRRVIINYVTGKKRDNIDGSELDELAFLITSGSDRIGALDFQESGATYKARNQQAASLEELQQAAELIEQGIPLPRELDQALNHGSSIGGARPKASIESNGKKYIAKFSGSNDSYSVVKAEYIAMRLAALAGLNVANVELAESLGKDIILVERFDRISKDEKWLRKPMVSALTIFGLAEHQAAYASYGELAEKIRHHFSNPKDTLKELYSRLIFNVLVGNTDDHARNHAAFWDGELLTLTPAYDICPQPRTGGEASHSMIIHNDSKISQLGNCLAICPSFQLAKNEAMDIMESQVRSICEHWDTICDEGKITAVEKNYFWRRQFLNPNCFFDLDEEHQKLFNKIIDTK
jgi:serine/threonine-protein kinase HipA